MSLFFLVALVILCLGSFWLTHQSTSRIHVGAPRSRLPDWFVTDPGEVRDEALRAATDSMDLVRLRETITTAETVQHDSLALATAKFVYEHLADEFANVGTPAVTAKHTIVTPAPGGVGIDQTKPVVAPSTTTTPVVTSESTLGKPIDFDWWQHPSEELAPLLPSPQSAASFEALLEPETTIQARHDVIVALAGPDYHPSKFPIGIVAYNRPDLLKTSIESLLRVRGISKSQVTLYQDGTDQGVKRVAIDAGITVQQHLGNQNLPGQEGAAQIARHYKWAFTSIFKDNPTADYAIVVEDDMTFAPDFLTYFAQLAPLYAKDPSIYCITSWNDNAQSGLALDPRIMLRTDFFIGLGWMISRKIYKNELEPQWPATHWDHWLRDPNQRKNRECIYPEVPRNYNIGKRGTHSDDGLYAKYFERIVVNKQEAVWLGDIDRMISQTYEAALLTRLRDSIQLSSLVELEHHSYASVSIFLSLTSRDDSRWEKVIAPYFGLWHSIPLIRGMYHNGAMHIRWNTNYVLLIASYVGTFAKFRATSTLVLDSRAFHLTLEQITIIKSLPGGDSCFEACRRASRPTASLTCSDGAMARINDCSVLTTQFGCVRCDRNAGIDQPAYVHKPGTTNFGLCLVNNLEPTCAGGHSDTTRLCGCVRA